MVGCLKEQGFLLAPQMAGGLGLNHQDGCPRSLAFEDRGDNPQLPPNVAEYFPKTRTMESRHGTTAEPRFHTLAGPFGHRSIRSACDR